MAKKEEKEIKERRENKIKNKIRKNQKRKELWK